ncbi:MAG: PilN domain-containing protein [Alkalinema sp. CAN_BIN05]|nr:PilN domain-containing protein [Alkalinema sp. CAN_BIN05]
MFNLDINFLNDRPDLKPGATSSRGGVVRRPSGGTESPVPLYAGILTALTLLGLTGGALGYYNWQKGELTTREAELDSKLGAIASKQKELDVAKKKVTDAEAEIKALATVFNQIKPWSAMSQDLRERLPPGVQIASIVQAPIAAGAAVAGTNPIYSPDITIKGEANDFDQVNDLLVILKKSNFLRPDSIKIIETARLESKPLPAISLPKAVELPVKPGQEKPKDTNNQAIKLPGRVTFTVQSKMSEAPTSELLRELDRKGAVGLVTRVEALKSKGVKP